MIGNFQGRWKSRASNLTCQTMENQKRILGGHAIGADLPSPRCPGKTHAPGYQESVFVVVIHGHETPTCLEAWRSVAGGCRATLRLLNSSQRTTSNLLIPLSALNSRQQAASSWQNNRMPLSERGGMDRSLACIRVDNQNNSCRLNSVGAK